MADVREETHLHIDAQSITIYDPRLPNGFLICSGPDAEAKLDALLDAGWFRRTGDARPWLALELTAAGIAHYAPRVDAERRAWFAERGLPDNPVAKPQGVMSW